MIPRRNSLDAGAKPGQLEVEPLVASLQMMGRVDDGSPACRKGGKDQGRACPEIGCGHFGTLIAAAAGYLRAAGDTLQIGSKSIQLRHVSPTHGKDAVL
ncbi:MAG: hypothetical protein ABSG53_27680, partial [Thermoguttaceae bacterium]